MIDLHSHILPMLDDGAPDREHAVEMARMAVEDGIRQVVCTPHWIPGLFENGRDVVLHALGELRGMIREREIPLDLLPGTELRLDAALPDKIEAEKVLTLNDDGRYVLIELPMGIIPYGIENIFYELELLGVRVVLAHPERHPVLMKDPARLYGWVEMGALTQITAGSLLGRFGPDVKKFAIFMMEHAMAHVLATDMHGPTRRRPRLSEALEEAGKVVGAETAGKMVHEAPMRIVEGNEVERLGLIPISRRSSLVKRFFSFFSAASD